MSEVLAMSPERSELQRMTALEEATRVRVHRAQVKRDLKARRVVFAEVLDDPDCATARVLELLVALPYVGRVRAKRVLSRARVSLVKTVGELSARQRQDLLAELERRPSVRAGTIEP